MVTYTRSTTPYPPAVVAAISGNPPGGELIPSWKGVRKDGSPVSCVWDVEVNGYGYVYLLNGEGVDKFDSDGKQVDFERAYFDVGLAVDGHGTVYGVNHSWLDSASYAEGNVSVFEILKFSPEGVLIP